MRKLYVFIVTLALALPAGAQVYIGGALGFNWHSNNQRRESVGESTISGSLTLVTDRTFSFTPTIGYRFNDKWAVGLDLDLYLSNHVLKGGDLDGGNMSVQEETSERGWQAAPFVRYNLFRIKKFGIDLKLSGRIGTSKDFQKFRAAEDGCKYLKYGAALSPVLTLDINGHFALESTLGIASIGWEGYRATSETGNLANIISASDNYITLGLNNMTALSLGCIYKF